MILQHDNVEYDVGRMVSETEAHRWYLGGRLNDGRRCMLQVATGVEHNGGLERAAFVLRQLRQTSDLFEEEHAKTGKGGMLSYERLFPEVLDGFIPEDQGGRRINILAFAEIDAVTSLVPLSNLAERDNLRVSLTSSAWVMGRILKLLGLAHGEGFAVRVLGGNNILLEPQSHYAVVLDWSGVRTFQGETPVADRKFDISTAARSVFTAIGGNPENGEYLYTIDDQDRRYVELLWSFANSRQSSAEKAHQQFYELVGELWGREFRKFQTLPL